MNIKIDELFNGQDFDLFKSFCEKKGIKYISELDISTFIKFKNYRRAKDRRNELSRKNEFDLINLRVSALKEISLSLSSSFENEENEILKIDISSFSIYPIIKEMTIWEVISALNVHGINDEHELLSKNVVNIGKLKDANHIKLKQKLLIIPTLDAIATELIKGLSDRDLKIVKYRFNSDKTLNSIGMMQGLSPEGVRKIVNRTINEMMRKLKEIKYLHCLLLMKSNSFGLSEEGVKQFLSRDNRFLLAVLRKLDHGLIFNEKLKYYFSKRESDFIEKLLSEIENMPAPMLLEEFNLCIDKITPQYPEHEDSKKLKGHLLAILNYEKQGIYISRTKIKEHKKLEILFEKYLIRPIRTDADGINNLQQACMNVFDAKINASTAEIDAKIRYLDDVILVAPKTYQLIEEEILKNPVWNVVKEFIDDYLLDSRQMNIELVYNFFITQVKGLGVENKVHFYSIIKHLFSNQYLIGKGNTLNIYKRGATKKSSEEILEKTIINSNEILDKKHIALILNWKIQKVNNLVSSSLKFIQWDNKKVKHINSLDLTKFEIEEMYNVIINFMPQGFATTVNLYNEFKANPKMVVILNKNNIESDYILGNIIKKIYTTISGHSIFLYIEGSVIKSIREAVMYKFPGKHPKKEIIEYITHLGYSRGASTQIINDLCGKGLLSLMRKEN